jgi:hypothetical protein
MKGREIKFCKSIEVSVIICPSQTWTTTKRQRGSKNLNRRNETSQDCISYKNKNSILNTKIGETKNF